MQYSVGRVDPFGLNALDKEYWSEPVPEVPEEPSSEEAEVPVELGETVELAALAPPSLVSLPPHALLPQPAGRPLLVLHLLSSLALLARCSPAARSAPRMCCAHPVGRQEASIKLMPPDRPTEPAWFGSNVQRGISPLVYRKENSVYPLHPRTLNFIFHMKPKFIVFREYTGFYFDKTLSPIYKTPSFWI
jgi:hypothetical protein